jgi:hypothetical protein
MKRRRHNAGAGYGFDFHGAFAKKEDAARKEAKTPGSFIKSVPMRGGWRYLVLTRKESTVDGPRSTASNPQQKGVRVARAKKRKRNLFGFGGGGGSGALRTDQVRARQKDAIKDALGSDDFRAAARLAKMSPKKYARTHGLKLEGMGRRLTRRAGKALIEAANNPRRKGMRVAKANKKTAKRRRATRRRATPGAGYEIVRGGRAKNPVARTRKKGLAATIAALLRREAPGRKYAVRKRKP